MRKQLVAAGMHTRRHRNWRAGVQLPDGFRREAQGEVDLSFRNHSRIRAAHVDLDIAHVGEALRTQQLLGHILRRDANGGFLQNADRGGVRPPSSASGLRAPSMPAVAANDALVRKFAATLPALHRSLLCSVLSLFVQY